MVTIRYISYFKELAGYKEKIIEVKTPIKIRDLIPFSKVPDNRVIVLVNQKSVKLDHKVSADDSVVLLPVVGGG